MTPKDTSPSKPSRSDGFTIRRKHLIMGITLLVLVSAAYFLRPFWFVRGPFMFFYVYPIFAWFFAGSAAVFTGFVLADKRNIARKRAQLRDPGKDKRDKVSYDDRMRLLNMSGNYWLGARYEGNGVFSRHLIGTVVLVTLWLVMLTATCLLVEPMQKSQLAGSINFDAKMDISKLDGGDVRIKPYAVAKAQIENSFNSTTDKITNLRIVRSGGHLYWTGVKDPNGTIRSLTKPTSGVVTSDAETSSPAVVTQGKEYDAQFKYGPGMHVSENIKWQIRKKYCYTCRVTEQVGITTPRGPVIMVPMTKRSGGLFVRHEVFAGVLLFYPDGKTVKLSPRQAAASELVAQSGRMVPEDLAAQYADAYKYKHGLANRLFTHRDGYEVQSTEENSQPYMETFKNLSTPQWVTTMQARGRNGSTGLILFVDAATGKVRTWKAPAERNFIGNSRAMDIVKGERINGINFSGAFKVVEPRQVFPRGRLSYLVSIIPSAEGSAASRVTLNVIVDAEKQQVTKIFPASDAGDKDLIAYLNGETSASGYQFDGADEGGDSSNSTPADDADVPVSNPDRSSEAQTLQRLLDENRKQQKQLTLQEKDLQRLLEKKQKQK